MLNDIYDIESHRSTWFATFELVLARPPPLLALRELLPQCIITIRITGVCNGNINCLISKINVIEHPRKAPALCKHQYDMRLGDTKDVVSPGDMIFPEAKPDGNLHITAPIVSDFLPVVTENTHIVIAQRQDKSVQNISRQRAAKMPTQSNTKL